MKFLEKIINAKINGISGKELQKFAYQFNIEVSLEQAELVSQYLKGKNIDIFNETDRTNVLKEITKIAGTETAKKVNELFSNLIN
jgi:Protein of unknown function (DUF2624)